MKNLVYFTLGLLIAWILHAAWGAWQGQPWFDKEWFTKEGNQQFVSKQLRRVLGFKAFSVMK
jgi:hypothetical protein